MNQPSSVLLIGISDAGKTNFLSRLWLALDQGKGLLRKDGNPSNLEYLATGADHLLKGEFAPHTPRDVRDATEIPVKRVSQSSEIRGTLVVPDLPGEQVMSVFRTRQWSNEWEGRIKSGCGCLLFIRVDSSELVAPLDWMTCHHQFGGQVSPAPGTGPVPDEPKSPTQVVLVDWLQFLRKAFTELVGGAYRPRIGIVVSAWDRAPNDQKDAGPTAWIKTNLPLLSQFIETNDDSFTFEFFGVSATSGDFEADPDYKTSYLKANPRGAGEVVHSLSGTMETSSDATLPVAWALGFAEPSISGSES